jgi:hypothetical protein
MAGPIQPDPVQPEGWFSVPQLSKQLKISIPSMRRRVRIWIKVGKVEQRPWRTRQHNVILYRVKS